ncbi:MAG: helix-turn-helix domain-containing protein, partial [Acidimicrobiales bacterium]
PYLSQIERGLRRPSAEILQQIAKALRISAETLYVQAGILEPGAGEADVSRGILADPYLSEDQKQVLIRIYMSFRHENEAAGPDDGGTGADSASTDTTSTDTTGTDTTGTDTTGTDTTGAGTTTTTTDEGSGDGGPATGGEGPGAAGAARETAVAGGGEKAAR